MKIDSNQYDSIAAEIHSDNSPVGIDAKKTHIYIIHLLQQIDERLGQVESRLKALEAKTE